MLANIHSILARVHTMVYNIGLLTQFRVNVGPASQPFAVSMPVNRLQRWLKTNPTPIPPPNHQPEFYNFAMTQFPFSFCTSQTCCIETCNQLLQLPLIIFINLGGAASSSMKTGYRFLFYNCHPQPFCGNQFPCNSCTCRLCQ